MQDSSYNTIQTYDNIYGIIGVAPTTSASVPSGLIAIWSGAVGSIPSGWYLCNGQNGTPDLRNSFVLGAGNSYAVGATGGSTDAIVVSHTHTATSTSTVTDPGHNHNYISLIGGSTGIAPATSNSGNPNGNTTSNAFTGITVATSTSNATTGVSGSNANMPPYYALAYIMKS